MLKTYWFEFDFAEDEEMPFQLAFGCGVTAEDPRQAADLVMNKVFNGRPMPNLRRVLQGVDIKSLDPKYVIPFIGNHKKKGIWFPPYASG